MITKRTERITAANEKALLLYGEWKGKLKTASKVRITSREGLAPAYTPGAAEPYKAIAAGSEVAYRYITKSNTTAVVSDGSAVLGLGSIGPLAAMPIMEGKAVFFREFGGVSAFPIYLSTQDTQEIIETVVRIAPAFGSIDLEDISASRCFETEEALKERLNIPVFHDDQHSTAIVVLAGVISSLKLTDKKKEDCRVVVNDADSVNTAITELLLTYRFVHITMCDRSGILGGGADDLSWVQEKMTDVINLDYGTSTLTDAMKGTGTFVNVSAPGIVTQDMVASMNKDAVLFAMASPISETIPELAKAAGARVVGIGRSDFPNQVSSMVAFPGIFKGALGGHASVVTEEMKLVVAEVIVGLVDGKDLNGENILLEVFGPRVADVISNTVKNYIRK